MRLMGLFRALRSKRWATSRNAWPENFNGVALIASPLDEDVGAVCPVMETSRPVISKACRCSSPDGGVVRVASIYLPNGNPLGTEKFTYKLAWMERLIAHARHCWTLEEPLVLAGDYNIIPEPEDCCSPEIWVGTRCYLPQTRAGLPRP